MVVTADITAELQQLVQPEGEPQLAVSPVDLEISAAGAGAGVDIALAP